jgi:hypothetical protein
LLFEIRGKEEGKGGRGREEEIAQTISGYILFEK